jgi:hypothetical protein
VKLDRQEALPVKYFGTHNKLKSVNTMPVQINWILYVASIRSFVSLLSSYVERKNDFPFDMHSLEFYCSC